VDAHRAIAYSCNNWFAESSRGLSADDLRSGLLRFGLGTATGLVPGEAAGSVDRAADDDAKGLEALGEAGVQVTPLTGRRLSQTGVARRSHERPDSSGGVREGAACVAAGGLHSCKDGNDRRWFMARGLDFRERGIGGETPVRGCGVSSRRVGRFGRRARRTADLYLADAFRSARSQGLIEEKIARLSGGDFAGNEIRIIAMERCGVGELAGLAVASTKDFRAPGRLRKPELSHGRHGRHNRKVQRLCRCRIVRLERFAERPPNERRAIINFEIRDSQPYLNNAIPRAA
jgi:hypothetical protein